MPPPTPLPDHAWRPETRWAAPLIILLALAALLTAWGNVQRRLQARPDPEQISIQGRILDLQAGLLGPKAPWAKLEKQARSPWDKALLAIHAAEAGKRELAARSLAASPGSFPPAWEQAYGDARPEPRALEAPGKALTGTHAFKLLEARMLEKGGTDATPLRRAARISLMQRLVVLAALGSGGTLALLAGLGFVIFLAVKKPSPPPTLPRLDADGRALAILFLGWFLVMQLSGTVIQILLSVLPFLRPWALPLAYLFHAGFATSMLCRIEGIGFGQLWRRAAPPPHGRNLAWGAGYLGLTVLAALALSIALSPILPTQEPPQRELVDILTKAQGLHRTLPLFLTVALVAPCFEELLFRGCLIPALRRRLGPWPALAISALAFGAMHLQPLGLPMLSLLGITMGLAFLRTGSLWTSILVHGCWNGAQFLLMRALYG